MPRTAVTVALGALQLLIESRIGKPEWSILIRSHYSSTSTASTVGPYPTIIDISMTPLH